MPRKNVETLIQAFNLLAERFADLHLVLTGGTGYGSSGVLPQVADSAYHERIHLAGWVSEQDMGPLYAGAEALIFPSRHEGFGLPTLEAMAHGTPVVASFEAASAEIAGDAVLRVDCASDVLLADAIARLLTDKELHARLIRRGRIQVAQFRPERCARATLQVYQRAAGITLPSGMDRRETKSKAGAK